MPATEREPSRDRDSVLMQSHSWSEVGRGSIPMWDSSDPDRAPPPLPLNPSSQSPTTKANTSAGIAAAARLFVEKARESAPISSYTRNSDCTPSASPERSLIKGAHHRRMQSLQPGNVKDLRSYLDGRSPERSPERPSSTSDISTFGKKEAREDFSPLDRSSTPTPSSRDQLKDTPSSRPAGRPPPRPLLGENTPPSATMLALQTMHVPDKLLHDIPLEPISPTPSKLTTNLDFSSQLINLTTIANNLQREMSQLSRRSKDNATDLISLKEATNQRDEDIRKTLRELASNLQNGQSLLGPPPAQPAGNRSTSAYANIFDSKVFSSPPSTTKPYTLPRAASAHSFLEDGLMGSPSPYSVEGAASVAMLEKIIREMVTKEGQERLQSSLSELLEKSRKENSDAVKKVEELSEFIKEQSESQALVPMSKNGIPRPEFAAGSPGAKTHSADGKEARMISPNDEVMLMLQRIKDSVTHSGGTSSEVKGLVRDLRGEVLGMGRELGRKLDLLEEKQPEDTLNRSVDDSQQTESTEQVQRIVEEGIAELKIHLADIVRQRVDDNDTAFKQLATRAGPDEDGIFTIMKHALAEHGAGMAKQNTEAPSPEVDREGILDAVKEGLKDFEPNIELQQFGLERDEILAVLKEGLEDYQRNRASPAPVSIDKGEVFEVMQEALKGFQAPLPYEHIAELKEELIGNVRQALEEFHPAISGRSLDDEATRAAFSEAVKEGLANHGSAATREIEISREDLFDAVKASLDGSTIPFGGFGEQVLQQLHDLIDGMRVEFKQYSAANGRDTEQVLDALKDGLESLREEIESHVDRAQESNRDEDGKREMLEFMRSEFEHLHHAVHERDSSREVDDSKMLHATEIIVAMKEGMDELKTHVSNSRGLGEDGPSEEVFEAMKEEFEQLKMALLNANAHDKSELLETIQDNIGALHSKLNESEIGVVAHGSGAGEEVISELRSQFAELKEVIHGIIVDGDREAIVGSVRQSIEDLRIQLAADQSDASAEALGMIKEELERFRTQLNSSGLVEGALSRGVDDETLSTIKSGFEEIKEHTSKDLLSTVSVEMLEAIRGEFQNLRGFIVSSAAHGGSNEEMLDTLRLGLDDLRSHMDKKLDNPDRASTQQGELLDAFNEGLESLRGDVLKTVDKPLDMTVNYEILDALKDGLAGIRADMEKLKTSDPPVPPKGGEVVLADSNEVGQAREIHIDSEDGDTTPTAHSRSDVENVEVLITQLQIKIEAMDATMHDLSVAQESQTGRRAATTDDIVCLETMLKELQDNIASLGNRGEAPSGEGLARKDDTDAIETLLRNTKAQLEELSLSNLADVATKDNLDSVEVVVRVTNDAIDAITEKLESSIATKADVAVVEILAQDIKTAVDELKEHTSAKGGEDEVETMTKADLDVLGIICTEIKSKVNEISLSGPEGLPSKADVEQLEGLINDFRESHEKMREGYENDIAITAKAFDDRKQEFEDTIREINEVKSTLTEMKEELLTKMLESDCSTDTLGVTLTNLEESTKNHIAGDEIRDLFAKVAEDLERAHGSLDSLKEDHQQATESTFEKQAEHRSALESLISEKLEVYFDGLMSKYDDAQQAANDKAKAMEEQAVAQEELMASTKVMTDELKLSIDTLGTTLTTFCATFPGTVDKMAEESRTVFNKVDDTLNKLDETQEGLRSEHYATRSEVSKTLAAIGGIQTDLTEHNPRFMVALKEVQALIGQHHETSRRAFDAAADHAQAVKDLQEQVRGLGNQNDDLRNNVIPGLASLPAPMPTDVETSSDKALHDKLDQIMNHARESPDASNHLERLDQIHEKVMTTAAEVSAFVSQQTRQITQDHDSKEREAEELALLLERRQVEKDNIEDDITVLNEERDTLQNLVNELKSEKEALATQKARLAAEVSSLETAMHIRRDELHEMDRKAEKLERRMLDGVMNQSRMLLLSKGVKSPPKKKPQGRDLRIPSNTSATSAQTVTSSVPPLRASHALAMRSRPLPRTGNAANTAERRIMSLNQINHNIPTGASAFSPAPSLIGTGFQSMKRSHSVKTQSLRKPSWSAKGLASQNKENEVLSEESDEDMQRPDSRYSDLEDDLDSEAGTERRTSHISGIKSTHDGTHLGTEDDHSMYSASEASYFTGSQVDHRDSFGSSANGIVGLQSAIHEEPDEDEENDVFEEAETSSNHNGAMVLAHQDFAYAPMAGGYKHGYNFVPPSDSGIGTDLPTAPLSSNGDHYFK